MQAILGTVVAVSSFGVAYAAHIMFPVQPIPDRDMLLSRSTVGTLNFIQKNDLLPRTTRQLINLYLNKNANLQDVIESITDTSNINDAYSALLEMPPTIEKTFLIKAVHSHYPELSPIHYERVIPEKKEEIDSDISVEDAQADFTNASSEEEAAKAAYDSAWADLETVKDDTDKTEIATDNILKLSIVHDKAVEKREKTAAVLAKVAGSSVAQPASVAVQLPVASAPVAETSPAQRLYPSVPISRAVASAPVEETIELQAQREKLQYEKNTNDKHPIDWWINLIQKKLDDEKDPLNEKHPIKRWVDTQERQEYYANLRQRH